MGPLSNVFKRSEIFKVEFDKIFPAETFNKVNILKYITACTGEILKEAQEKYHAHGLRFINPLFIVNREIFPASNLPGDRDVLKFTRPVFELVASRAIIPLSQPVVDNLLSGICLFFGKTAGVHDFKLFKTFNLDILPDIAAKPGGETEINIANEIRSLNIHVNKYPTSFLDFSNALSAISEDDKIVLIKTLILYKSMSAAINDSLVFSFVNKFNPSPSFFDCLLTFVSDRPFDEDELLDFAHITESLALPIVNFDYSKSKGISAHTMAKRHSLKEVLVDTFKHA